ncbi:MAG: hypothetical protein PF961_01290 [Planctomycetota bacterium]|jgi:chemotaxis protein MotB|nr:hypothetical protein [Planctomycetota bacterium]
MAIPEDSGPPDTPDWIVTFTDLMSLLLTFFILLLTFSTPKVENLFQLRGSIAGSFGVFSGPKDDLESITPPSDIMLGREQQNLNAPALPPRFLPLEEHDPNRILIRLRDQGGEEINFDRVEEGYRVRIGEAVRFPLGEEAMDSSSFARLAKVAQALQHLPYHIVVVGYVGGSEVETVLAAGRDPMDLAIRRAVHVATRLGERHGVATGTLAVAGYGPEPGDRSSLGRVEMILADRGTFSVGGR